MRWLIGCALALLSIAAYGDDDTVAVPPCPAPARLEGKYVGAPGYFVGLKKSVVLPRDAAAALAREYGFEYQGFSSSDDLIFVPSLSQVIVDMLRCEPNVDYISFNRIVDATHPTG